MYCTPRILGDACVKLREYSIEGIKLDQNRIGKFVGESLMLVTALSPIVGYDKASAIAHRALDQNTTLREAALSEGVISAEEFDKVMDPKKMVGNPRRDLGMLDSDSL
jgi:fumarate hydratase, class II